MRSGEVIRKYRKAMNLTQREVAHRLGVTTPAVNKWENGNSMPDISLLSPLARLLNISVDTLLSHDKELSDTEANRLVATAVEKLKTEPFEAVFQWVKQRLAEYPNCHSLALWMAQVLNSQLLMRETSVDERYTLFILECYTRVLESENDALKTDAAESLYYFHIQKGQYAEAEKYLDYFSEDNPERKRKQALICSETGRQQEAYKMYEELLFAGYQSASAIFNDLSILALREGEFEKAHYLVQKLQALARLFEFGEYHEIAPGLELATLQKNEADTLCIMEGMLANLESIYAFTKSPLYAHMEFKEADPAYFAELRSDLLKGFQDEETFAYLKDNQQWKALTGRFASGSDTAR
jgi:transcriptional regulator with XRE-family HTH domain